MSNKGTRSVTPASLRLRRVFVPVLLFCSSTLMALAWLGHLRFKEWPFLTAMFACWLLVLPEYLINVAAIRFGFPVYTGAQMAAFRLCSGVVCVALVSRVVLGEVLDAQKLAGFALMVLAMALVAYGRRDSLPAEAVNAQDTSESSSGADDPAAEPTS